MIPVVAAEYKLVLVGDSAVGTVTINKESLPSSASLSTENTINISSPPSASTSSSEELKSATMKSNYKSGTLQVIPLSLRTINIQIHRERVLQ